MGKISLVVGTEVFGDPYGNFARGQHSPVVGHITKIGRKYFYVNFGSRWSEYPFDLKTCKFVDLQNTNGGYELFASMEDYAKEKERRRMVVDLRKHFDRFGNNNDTFESIKTAYDAIFGQEAKH